MTSESTIIDLKEFVLDTVYPVGSIYVSANNVNPSSLFGGSWTKIEGKFLLASSSSHALNSTGGSETHTLTTDEMPSHNHTQTAHTHQPSETAGKFVVTNNSDWKFTSGRPAMAGSGQVYYAYTTDTNASIGEYNKTSSVAPAIQNNGGGEAHNNMPPYLVVNVWRRDE